MIIDPLNLDPLRIDPDNLDPDDGRSYRIYSRPQIEDLGNDTLLATIARDGSEEYEYTVTGDPGSEQWVYVRAVNRLGKEDTEPVRPKLRRIKFDDAGNFIAPAPNVPDSLELTVGAGGLVTASWHYTDTYQEVAPAAFNVYVAEDDDAIDFDTPTYTTANARTTTQSLGTFDHDTVVRVVVRAISAAGGETSNTDETTAIADALAPDAPGGLTVEVS